MLLFLLSTLLSVNPDAEAILRILDAQASSWNNGDIRGYMDGYWESDSLVFTSGGTINRGWKATYEKYLHSYDTPAKMGTLSFSGIEVYNLSEHAAWVLGRWDLKRDPDNPGGVFSLILRKFPEGWRITHDHTSLRQGD